MKQIYFFRVYYVVLKVHNAWYTRAIFMWQYWFDGVDGTAIIFQQFKV